MGPRIIFVQGPPGSGKDAIGTLLSKRIPNSKIVKFAEVLKNRTHALYGLYDKYGFLPHYAFDATKDQPSPDFLGLTPRQAYIAVSETYFKPQHGKDVFGVFLAAQLKTDGTVYIVTDSGFPAEAKPIIEKFGDDQCVVLQMFRRGKTFAGDSRGYWVLGSANTFSIVNDGSLEDLAVIADSNVKFLFPPTTESPSHEPSSCFAPRPGSDR
jgi:hypothetical protein